ncbi:phage capsid family protein [Bartonella sp. F02]|uniref:phage capsid family protein n=1 Tax=Bartonella sp. F02 TaxID=2967262 RepID=UPI0022A8E6C8|nr:DUF4043 family protein [Bartonella sp. F02]MCZ2329028.1 DUF4043 family protein [Bartonella sp. F02]
MPIYKIIRFYPQFRVRYQEKLGTNLDIYGHFVFSDIEDCPPSKLEKIPLSISNESKFYYIEWEDKTTQRTKSTYYEIFPYVQKETKIAPLIGENSENIIQLKTESNHINGDKVSFDFNDMSEDNIKIQNELVLGRLFRSGKREHDSDKSVYLLAEYLEQMFFLHACGYTAPTFSLGGENIKPVYYGFNKPMAPSNKRIIRPCDKIKDEELTDKCKHIFTFDLIEKAVKCAECAEPKIKSLEIERQKFYVMYLHPIHIEQLRAYASCQKFEAVKKRARELQSKSEDPLIQAAFGVYYFKKSFGTCNVLLLESGSVTLGVNSVNNMPLPNVRRSVLLGAQSAILAFGTNPTNNVVIEETIFDFENKRMTNALLGIKKTRLKLLKDAEEQDFATVVVSTYADKDNIQEHWVHRIRRCMFYEKESDYTRGVHVQR